MKIRWNGGIEVVSPLQVCVAEVLMKSLLIVMILGSFAGPALADQKLAKTTRVKRETFKIDENHTYSEVEKSDGSSMGIYRDKINNILEFQRKDGRGGIAITRTKLNPKLP
jgi:hypothetical protein